MVKVLDLVKVYEGTHEIKNNENLLFQEVGTWKTIKRFCCFCCLRDKNADRRTTAVDGVSFGVKKGEVFTLLGT